MKYETPKTWKANLFKYFYTYKVSSLAALIVIGFKHYKYRYLFVKVSLDKMYRIRPVIIMYTLF